MTIHNKDIKLLWYRAAGRCSICKEELSVEAPSPSGKTLIGQNCHIVGEKLYSGPRHESNLTESDRNRYPNLILLCANHHKEIDSDEQKYTVEVLHQIKSDHEVWVQAALTQNDDTIAKRLYSDLINHISDAIRLDMWDRITDNAIRTVMHDEIVVGMREIVIKLNRVDWPSDETDLEEALKEFADRLNTYIEHYTSFAYPKSKSIWIENKRLYNDLRTGFPTSEGQKKEKENYHIHFINLWNLTVSLNNLARCVRDSINKEFFFLQGDFVICDDIGVTNEMQSCVYFPKEYKGLENS